MTTQITEKLNNLVSNFEAFRQDFMTKAREEFNTTIKEIFDFIPEINYVTWVQYTPYFNDGDTCEFMVGDISFTNASEEEIGNVYYGEYDGEDESVFVYPCWGSDKDKVPLTKEQKKVIDDFTNVCNSSAFEDIMLFTFGDHVRVIGNRDGFSVEEYEHD